MYFLFVFYVVFFNAVTMGRRYGQGFVDLR